MSRCILAGEELPDGADGAEAGVPRGPAGGLAEAAAAALGVTEAALIRRGLERLGRSPDAWPPDPAAWAEARALIARRLELAVPQTGRTWTRDDVYEDRLRRATPAVP